MKIRDIKPMHDLVVMRVRRDKNMIQLPESTAQENKQFVVIAAGPGRVDGGQLWVPSVKPGDVVIFGNAQVLNLRCDDGMALMISNEALAAVVDHVNLDEFLSTPDGSMLLS